MASRGSLVRGSFLVLLVSLGACDASTKNSSAPTPSTGKPKIEFYSPVLTSANLIPDQYRCARGIWLPLQWGTLPPDTGEVAFYVAGFGRATSLSSGWSLRPVVSASLVVGVKPTLTRLGVGALPSGAFLLNEGPLAMCPTATHGRRFVFRIFAIPHAQRVVRSLMNPYPQSGLLKKLSRDALATGEFTATYGQA
jgi:hypothetical protein